MLPGTSPVWHQSCIAAVKGWRLKYPVGPSGTLFVGGDMDFSCSMNLWPPEWSNMEDLYPFKETEDVEIVGSYPLQDGYTNHIQGYECPFVPHVVLKSCNSYGVPAKTSRFTAALACKMKPNKWHHSHRSLMIVIVVKHVVSMFVLQKKI